MKWMRRVFLGLMALIAALAVTAVATALRAPRPVGFETVRLPDGPGRSLAMGVWYPTDARPWPTTFAGVSLMEVARDAPVAGNSLPLVVISHGNGGGLASHADLALALAAQGFVVAAPMHAGDNFADQSAVSSPDWLVNRTRELHAAIDYMLATWPSHGRIDGRRVGVYGFSAGGFTALAEIGAVPDLHLLADHCANHPEFVCKLLSDAHSPLLSAQRIPLASAYAHDSRIRAAVIAAPGLGFTFTPAGLREVGVPVQLWSGSADTFVPTESNAGAIRNGLGERAELHVVAGATHLAFLTPCGLIGPPALCRDGNGFDRKQFHASMNAEVAAFFQSKL